MKTILAALLIVFLALMGAAHAQCVCYSPDYINVKNGDLIADGPAPGFRPYRWRGWDAHRTDVAKICSRRGSTCTAETRAFIAGR